MAILFLLPGHWLERSHEKHQPQAGPHLDIEDLTHTLDHIQDLIDKDPIRSRNEITEFSLLLRNGYLK